MSFEAAADVQPQVDDDKGDDADRNVDVEAPSPVDLCKNTSKKRAQACPNGEHNVLDCEVRPTFPQRYKITENHLSEQVNTTGSKALHDSPKDEDGARVGDPANPTSNSEDSHGCHHRDFSPPHIAKLAIHWLEDCTCKEERSSHPREFGAEVEGFGYCW